MPRSLKGFEKTAAEAKPHPTKRLTISDPDTRGLYLRVMPSGHKSWTIVARNPAGKQVWASAGDYDRLSLGEARALAKEGVKRIRDGEKSAFPKAEPIKAPETFETVCGNFLTRHVEKQAHRTADETKRIFRVYVTPRWGSKIFTDIKRGDVARLLDGVEDNNGPVMADRVLAALSKLFNWYASREDDYSSPIVRGMGRTNGRERARKRILSDDEIKLLWKAASEAGTFGAFVQTCLLTGQRRAKVAAMEWETISSDGEWTIQSEAREKTNAGSLRLPQRALDIINAQKHFNDNPHVFAGRGKKAIAGFSKLKRDLDAKVTEANDGKALPAWVLHDLRRTAKSLMARAGVRPDVSERVLGHVIAGVEGVYDRHSYQDEKADALERLAGLVELVANPPKGNVTLLERKAS